MSVLHLLFLQVFRPLRAQLCCGSPQIAACHEDVGLGEQRKQLLAVLVQPTVAGPPVTELALDDAEDMLDGCADRG